MTYRLGKRNPLNIYEVTPGDADDRSVTLPPWHHRSEFGHGQAEAVECINERIRALESGGG